MTSAPAGWAPDHTPLAVPLERTDEYPVVADRRRRRWPKRVALGVLLALLAGVVYYAITLAQVVLTARHDEARPADAIVVLGAAQYDGRPSPVLKARLDHALALYQQGIAPLIVVTGGKQPLDRFTEATASANYLIEHGVPDSAIAREVQGRTSWQSLAAAARILRDRGLTRVVLVSDPYHSLRIKETAQEVGLQAYASPTRTSPERGMRAFKRMMREAAGIAVARLPFMSYHRLLRITG